MKRLKGITKGILLMVVFSLMLVGCSSNKIPDEVREEFWEAAKINYKIIDNYMNSKTREEYHEFSKTYDENIDTFNKFIKTKDEGSVEKKIKATCGEIFLLNMDYYLVISEYEKGDKMSEEDKAKIKEIKEEYKNNLKELKKEIKVDILK
ncbi:hypothetical protein [Clostridium sp. UBA6640]|uniref:hypothetical protein n=1 Tax=Clostridium sp. UBA6640 TaxID=1946370 RepID=UPI0025B995F9|nr:hypothetical protein [Clostridium sp. UBA6640]